MRKWFHHSKLICYEGHIASYFEYNGFLYDHGSRFCRIIQSSGIWRERFVTSITNRASVIFAKILRHCVREVNILNFKHTMLQFLIFKKERYICWRSLIFDKGISRGVDGRLGLSLGPYHPTVGTKHFYRTRTQSTFSWPSLWQKWSSCYHTIYIFMTLLVGRQKWMYPYGTRIRTVKVSMTLGCKRRQKKSLLYPTGAHQNVYDIPSKNKETL